MNGPTFTSPRSKTKKTNTPVATTDIDQAEEGTQTTNAMVHLTPAERAARGKAARAEVPRSSHAGWDAPSGRPDPVTIVRDRFGRMEMIGMRARCKRIPWREADRGRGVTAAYRPFKPGGGGSSPSGPNGA